MGYFITKKLFALNVKEKVGAMSWKNRMVARHLFNRTKEKYTFSSNDLRQIQHHKLLGDPNAIGAFFRYLQKNGLAIRLDQDTKSIHQASHGRRVGSWRWTKKAQALLYDPHFYSVIKSKG